MTFYDRTHIIEMTFNSPIRIGLIDAVLPFSNRIISFSSSRCRSNTAHSWVLVMSVRYNPSPATYFEKNLGID